MIYMSILHHVNLPSCSSRPEAVAIFVRIDKAEDHVPVIVRVCRQRGDPVGVANRVRVAPQVTEVLQGHERADEELIRD